MNSNVPVFPEVGSMTTLVPGISFPSCSATSTMRFAIRSLTLPPADVYSSLPTCKPSNNVNRASQPSVAQIGRTEVALQPFMFCYLVEPDERGLAHCFERVVNDARPGSHCLLRLGLSLSVAAEAVSGR